MPSNPFLNKPMTVTNEGTRIVLPQGMTDPQAIEVLQRKMAEDAMTVNVVEDTGAYPFDGAHALMIALKEKYGWASPVPTPGFFGDTPPTTIDLEIGFDVHVPVIWGSFRVPGIEGTIQTQANWRSKNPTFILTAEVKKRDEQKVRDLAALVREVLKDRSVYKGKAIRIKVDETGVVNMSEAPTFLDLSRVDENELIFPANTQEQVVTSLFTPIEHTALCRKHGIPLKRGVLLEGPYGCGKTLTAYVTAKKAAKNGWTFIYLDRVTGLREALEFAKRYAPAVVFAEDVDRVTSGQRDMEMDDILNIIDGVDSKGGEIITILTTNFVEKIDRAMLRPGRLDAVISVKAPDKAAAERLLRQYARGLIAPTEDLSEAGDELDGTIPAVIREVVERSKLYAISHLKAGEEMKLNGTDIAAAARGMKHHLSLLNPNPNKPLTAQESLGKALADIVAEAQTSLDLPNKVADEVVSRQ